MINASLLEEAIVNAKAVRATASANAYGYYTKTTWGQTFGNVEACKCSYCGSRFKEETFKCPNCGESI